MNDIRTRSFIAKLSCTTDDYEGPVGFSDSHLHAQAGWLILGPDGESLPLRFEYIEHTDSRIHYNIYSATPNVFNSATLGVSLNGYLGLYTLAQVRDFWKAEPLGEWVEGADIDFILRDHLGQRVGIHNDTYLTVGVRPVAKLRAKILKVL